MGDHKLIEYLIGRIETIDKKVDKLLEFKWQIIGGSIVASVIMSGIVQVLFLVFNK